MVVNCSTNISRKIPLIDSRSHHCCPTFYLLLLIITSFTNVLTNLYPDSLGRTNLRVFQQRTAPDQDKNLNIGVIQVKLKNWMTTTTVPTPFGQNNGTHYNGTWESPRHQKRRRQNEERTTERGGGVEMGTGGWTNDMDGLFPYLLLALGLALVAFFVILYAILNALLQRKESEQRGSRRKRHGREKNMQDKEWMEQMAEEEDEEEGEQQRFEGEDDELDSLEDGTPPPLRDKKGGTGRRPPARSRWGEHKQHHGNGNARRSNKVEEEADWHAPRRYRTNQASRGRPSRSTQQQHFVPPPPPREAPPRPDGQRHRRREWEDEEGSLSGGLLPFPPPPPPRVPPPPPPLPTRYQRRRPPDGNGARRHQRHQGRCGGVHLPTADEMSDMDSESVHHPPHHPLRRENTDSTISSMQRGRTGSL